MKKYYLLILVASFLFVGCSKDDDGGSNTQFDGSISAISDFLGTDTFEIMVGLGMTINSGDNPPNIEGTYLSSPNILENSNIETDYPGRVFLDYQSEFTNQKGLLIDFSGLHLPGGSQVDVGNGAFISGEGNLFSVFLITETEIQGDKADTVIVYSGEISPDGIYSYQRGFFMKNNYGSEVFIDNGKGRILNDEDGLAERI